jgi:hypothetical protein
MLFNHPALAAEGETSEAPTPAHSHPTSFPTLLPHLFLPTALDGKTDPYYCLTKIPPVLEKTRNEAVRPK